MSIHARGRRHPCATRPPIRPGEITRVSTPACSITFFGSAFRVCFERVAGCPARPGSEATPAAPKRTMTAAISGMASNRTSFTAFTAFPFQRRTANRPERRCRLGVCRGSNKVRASLDRISGWLYRPTCRQFFYLLAAFRRREAGSSRSGRTRDLYQVRDQEQAWRFVRTSQRTAREQIGEGEQRMWRAYFCAGLAYFAMKRGRSLPGVPTARSVRGEWR